MLGTTIENAKDDLLKVYKSERKEYLELLRKETKPDRIFFINEKINRLEVIISKLEAKL